MRVLALAQIFGGIGAAAGAAVGALLAAELATESLSGLSSTASVIGTAVIALPVSRVMNEHGRRPGLQLAYAIGIGGAILVVLGAMADFFPLALLGLFLTGGGYAAGLQSRYAAADLASPIAADAICHSSCGRQPSDRCSVRIWPIPWGTWPKALAYRHWQVPIC